MLKINDKDKMGLVISSIFLFVGLIITGLYKYIIGTTNDNTILFILFSPLIIFLAVSGRLKELKAPGFEAKLSEAADEEIKIASQSIELSKNDQDRIAQKETLTVLMEKKSQLKEKSPIILTAVLGRQDYYASYPFLQYIKILSQFASFKYIVLLDKNNYFVGYFKASVIKDILEDNDLSSKLINAINMDNRQELFDFPGIITETILPSASNAETLSKMEKNNIEAIIVIDESNYLKGLITRDQIINRMILSLTK